MRRKDLMKLMMATAILLGLAAPVAAAPQAVRPDGTVPEVGSFYQQDPADEAYRAARERLNQGDYRRAAEMFAQVYRQYPRSNYAAQALYYQAFALYRNGGDRDLRAAEDALRELQSRYADEEVAQRDAEELLARAGAADPRASAGGSQRRRLQRRDATQGRVPALAAHRR
jgi:TolA-binding protein